MRKITARNIAKLAAIALCLLLTEPVLAQASNAESKPKDEQNDFVFQGEYSGQLGTDEKTKFGVQVVARGDGKFSAVGFPGGLPGDGWAGEKLDIKDAELRDGKLMLVAETGTGVIEDGNTMFVSSPDGWDLGALKKVVRKSPTLGKQPPQNAIVLFDGSSSDGWKNGKMSDDNLLCQGTTSNRKFGSHELHIEFRLPFIPKARGQARGNSGLYVQGRYEVQMLDSFGLDGKMNQCGGIYSVKDCDLNMCFPPLSWQTYDIEFTAAKYQDDKLVANPRMTVYHNGVKIHDNVKLPSNRGTTAAPVKAGPAKGPIYLQDHGSPVRYRNIWVVEKVN